MIGKRTARTFFPLAALALVGVDAACGSIPVETSSPPAGREIAPAGVMKGTVSYTGPHPCSSNGHIVGAAVLFVFDKDNPPPPNGLATTPVNFGVVSGDTLFANEPRSPGSTVYCPAQNGVTGTITATAPFTIAPLTGGQYVIQSFYDSTGDFLPTFKISDLPEMGDIGGGDIDTIDALKPINATNPNYQPHFLPVDVGVAQAGPTDVTGTPTFTIPPEGFIADNLSVNLGAPLPTTRPYFYPKGVLASFEASAGTLSTTVAQSSATASTSKTGVTGTVETDPNYVPILTIPQDFPGLLAAPLDPTNEASVNNFESRLPHLELDFGVPAAERAAALAQPLHFQLGTAAGTGGADAGAGAGAGAGGAGMAGGAGATANGFAVWQNQTFDATTQKWSPQDIAEAQGIPQLWPLVVLQKLDFDAATDPTHAQDPASLNAQGSATAPVVILQGITLLAGNTSDVTNRDSLFLTGAAEQSLGALIDARTQLPNVFVQDHITVILKPAAICFDSLFDPNDPDKRGTLVLPSLYANSADVTAPVPNSPIIPTSALSSAQLAPLVGGLPIQACLPTGRYGINVIYPDGQAWTVPNEAGACVAAEGATDYASGTCTVQPRRPVIRSQGTRAVVEIVKATNPAACAGALAVPAQCLPAPH